MSSLTHMEFILILHSHATSVCFFYFVFPAFKHIESPFQLEGHSLDKRRHMVQHDGQMVINKVTTVGEVRENNPVAKQH